MADNTKKVSRWYFGGLASAITVCITHPLDLLKVQLQTQQEKVSIVELTVNIFKQQGIMGLYQGLSASIFRQLTYSTVRFGIYDVGKQNFDTTGLAMKVMLAAVAGAAGGFVGTPADVVNVRMQNDIKLAPEKRRNYKHVFDGFYRICRDEGASRLFTGATIVTIRAILMTVGQLSSYDQIKSMMLQSGMFNDNPNTHTLASLMTGVIATTITQPLDVIKTRTMNAKPGEYKSLTDVIVHIAKLGPLGFFKGYVPAFLRIAPNTVIVFLLLEQLRFHFGYFPQKLT